MASTAQADADASATEEPQLSPVPQVRFSARTSLGHPHSSVLCTGHAAEPICAEGFSFVFPLHTAGVQTRVGAKAYIQVQHAKRPVLKGTVVWRTAAPVLK